MPSPTPCLEVERGAERERVADIWTLHTPHIALSSPLVYKLQNVFVQIADIWTLHTTNIALSSLPSSKQQTGFKKTSNANLCPSLTQCAEEQ